MEARSRGAARKVGLEEEADPLPVVLAAAESVAGARPASRICVGSGDPLKH